MEYPTLKSENLTLRQLQLTDAKNLQLYAGDIAVASTTLSIPHPYENGMGEEWIKLKNENWKLGTSAVFGIALNENVDSIIGTVGLLDIDSVHSFANIGFWIGKPYWGRGYCTEAARVILGYGFKTLGINCIEGRHFDGNDGSGRVMIKIGMKYEGKLRQRKKRFGDYKDLQVYSILRSEYL